ncbi:MAG: hypothetical protein LUE20_01820 [Oscillospiraceae bacterium]|nr:hypothetical protein [Oscillospiraceae bacterium]
MADKVLNAIAKLPVATVLETANYCDFTKRTDERTIKALREQSKVVREGGKRYNHLKVL